MIVNPKNMLCSFYQSICFNETIIGVTILDIGYGICSPGKESNTTIQEIIGNPEAEFCKRITPHGEFAEMSSSVFLGYKLNSLI